MLSRLHNVARRSPASVLAEMIEGLLTPSTYYHQVDITNRHTAT